MKSKCKRCCLHEKSPVPLDFLRDVAKAFGMHRVKPPKGYVSGPDNYPTETWYLRIPYDKPAWNGETHGSQYYSVPRWFHRKSTESYWRQYHEFVKALKRTLKRQDVQPENRLQAKAALKGLKKRW